MSKGRRKKNLCVRTGSTPHWSFSLSLKLSNSGRSSSLFGDLLSEPLLEKRLLDRSTRGFEEELRDSRVLVMSRWVGVWLPPSGSLPPGSTPSPSLSVDLSDVWPVVASF